MISGISGDTEMIEQEPEKYSSDEVVIIQQMASNDHQEAIISNDHEEGEISDDFSEISDDDGELQKSQDIQHAGKSVKDPTPKTPLGSGEVVGPGQTPGDSSSSSEEDDDMEEQLLYLRLMALKSMAPDIEDGDSMQAADAPDKSLNENTDDDDERINEMEELLQEADLAAEEPDPQQKLAPDFKTLLKKMRTVVNANLPPDMSPLPSPTNSGRSSPARDQIATSQPLTEPRTVLSVIDLEAVREKVRARKQAKPSATSSSIIPNNDLIETPVFASLAPLQSNLPQPEISTCGKIRIRPDLMDDDDDEIKIVAEVRAASKTTGGLKIANFAKMRDRNGHQNQTDPLQGIIRIRSPETPVYSDNIELPGTPIYDDPPDTPVYNSTPNCEPVDMDISCENEAEVQFFRDQVDPEKQKETNHFHWQTLLAQPPPPPPPPLEDNSPVPVMTFNSEDERLEAFLRAVISCKNHPEPPKKIAQEKRRHKSNETISGPSEVPLKRSRKDSEADVDTLRADLLKSIESKRKEQQQKQNQKQKTKQVSQTTHSAAAKTSPAFKTLSKNEKMKHFPNLYNSVIVPLASDPKSPTIQSDPVFNLQLENFLKNVRQNISKKTTPPPKPARKNPPRKPSQSSSDGASKSSTSSPKATSVATKVPSKPSSKMSSSTAPSHKVNFPRKISKSPLSTAAKTALLASNVSHLPPEKQAEYKRLKEIIARKEKARIVQKAALPVPSTVSTGSAQLPKPTTTLGQTTVPVKPVQNKTKNGPNEIVKTTSNVSKPVKASTNANIHIKNIQQTISTSNPPPTVQASEVVTNVLIATESTTTQMASKEPIKTISRTVPEVIPEETSAIISKPNQMESENVRVPGESKLQATEISTVSKESVSSSKGVSQATLQSPIPTEKPSQAATSLNVVNSEDDEDPDVLRNMLLASLKSKKAAAPKPLRKRITPPTDDVSNNKIHKGILISVTNSKGTRKIQLAKKITARTPIQASTPETSATNSKTSNPPENVVGLDTEIVQDPIEAIEQAQDDERANEKKVLQEKEEQLIKVQKDLKQEIFKLSAHLSQLKGETKNMKEANEFAKELRRQLWEVEEVISRGKERSMKLKANAKKLANDISAMKKNKDVIEQECRQIGNNVFGTEYKPPVECSEDIRKKLALIKDSADFISSANETSGDFVSSANETSLAQSSESVQQIDSQADEPPATAIDQSSELVDDISGQTNIVSEKGVEIQTVDQVKRTEASENIVEPVQKDKSFKTVEPVVLAVKESNVIPVTKDIPSFSLAPDCEAKGDRAVSPVHVSDSGNLFNSSLAHLRSGPVAILDPFTQICQFELLGKCNDDKCPYQHHQPKTQ